MDVDQDRRITHYLDGGSFSWCGKLGSADASLLNMPRHSILPDFIEVKSSRTARVMHFAFDKVEKLARGPAIAIYASPVEGFKLHIYND